jgi:ferrous iron transport protein A
MPASQPRHTGHARHGRGDACRSLAELPVGARVRLCEHEGASPARRRLLDLGFVPGTALEVVRTAPLGDPLEVSLRGYRICLRRDDVRDVCVVPETEASAPGAPSSIAASAAG